VTGRLISSVELSGVVEKCVFDTPVLDIHTHLYDTRFGSLLLWGIDELLTYHYLVAEVFRVAPMEYDKFWAMSKQEQADYIWQHLFIERSPISEACRGVLTCMSALGLNVGKRDLNLLRSYFAEQTTSGYIDKVFETANIRGVIMTNDPFDDAERPCWDCEERDPRFKAALRIDALLNNWPAACIRLSEWGFAVNESLDDATCAEVRRFLKTWAKRFDPVYMAASLPPDFCIPENSARGKLVEKCVLPVGEELNLPFAMMIGVKKLINPDLRLAGDGAARSDLQTVEYLCREYPKNKFLLTNLSREDQHTACVVTRKFHNLHLFGCWWFLNNPSIIEDMTRMRFETLGLSITPQHSDARVLDQLVYKWSHSRKIIAKVLTDKYLDITRTGWKVTEDEIARDVKLIFGGAFEEFVGR